MKSINGQYLIISSTILALAIITFGNNLIKHFIIVQNDREYDKYSPVEEPSVKNITNEEKYPHDDPTHIWHWTRQMRPTPEHDELVDCNGQSYKELYDHFHEFGYVVFKSCSLNADPDTILNPLAEHVRSIEGVRSENSGNKFALELSVDPDILHFLGYVHGGRRAFPFQTLNFPKGTQQPVHSDLIHFDTFPRTLMSAAWTALEDMNENNGPLRFYPKSHHYGTWDTVEVGLDFIVNEEDTLLGKQRKYSERLEEMMAAMGIEEKTGHDLKKGETLFWAAGLIHGGSRQKDMSLTRLTQVTHYFFEGAESYWSPLVSKPGHIRYRTNIHPCRDNKRIPGKVFSCARMQTEAWLKRFEVKK